MESRFNLLLYLTTLLVVCCYYPNPVNTQRSLLHWKHDLEYRLNQYLNQQQAIKNIISSSIHSNRDPMAAQTRVLAGNVRFTDLIIPNGALVLETHVAQPTVRVLVNKTKSYVSSKMSELYQLRSQLEIVKRQLNDPTKQFILKGLPNARNPQLIRVGGTRVFKQFMYGHVIRSAQVGVNQINFTSVEHVLDETYMRNSKLEIVDSKQRLFFEGRKTLYRTVFTGQLKSGCCDRLKPLHTSRMMTRSAYQEIMAPVMLHTNGPRHKESVVIHQLTTRQIYNRALILGPPTNRLDDNGLLPSVPENFIHSNNLINIRLPYPREIYKTIVFRDALMVDEAELTPVDRRLLIRFASRPDLSFDLSHDNYLLKYPINRAATNAQHIVGTVVINGESQFNQDVFTDFVNQVLDFRRFATETVVRIDRPAVIRGSIQFNALPALFPGGNQARPPQAVLIMTVNGDLQLGLMNGMRYPDDLLLFPLHPNKLIHVRGPRQFLKPVSFEFLQVNQLVNGMSMPAGVIPLHLNDFMGSVGSSSNLWFVDGIVTNQVTVHSGLFDDIVIKENYGDAQNLIVRSVFATQPDGSHLIRAPLRVGNLRLLGSGPNRGLLNGFRPEDLIELSRQPRESVYGRKHFLAPVEATECIFGEINGLANWTDRLIRIDRPNTVQSVHSKLAFMQPQLQVNISNGAYLSPQALNELASTVSIGHFEVEFWPNNNPAHYLENLRFSPEFYILHRALVAVFSGENSGRYRVLNQVRLMSPSARINGIFTNDVVTLDVPFRFVDRFVMVGKVEVMQSLRANRITSNYPIDRMDLEQFERYRIPLLGSRAPIKLNNLILAANNRATFVQTRLLNGISFNEFASSIMSLTRPQVVEGAGLSFAAPINLEGLVRTESSLNGIKSFRQFARRLKTARYVFEDGLQCNSVMIKT